jgi:hypothetical protein
MAAKTCPICDIRKMYTGDANGEKAPQLSEMCNPCYAEGGWENTHSDSNHDNILELLEDVEWGKTTHETKAEYYAWKKECEAEISGCWICFPELNMAKKPAKIKKAPTGTKAPVFRRTQLNHKSMCLHAQTPKARRTCKNAFWVGVAAIMAQDKLSEDLAWEQAIKVLVAANTTPEPKPTTWNVVPLGKKGGVMNQPNPAGGK